MSDVRSTPPGARDSNVWRAFVERSQRRRAKLAEQTWPEFFRGLAIEIAAMAIVVGMVAAFVFLFR